MALPGGDFDAGNYFKAVMRCQFGGKQRAANLVVVCDGDNIKIGTAGGLKSGTHRAHAVAVGCMDMQISFAHKFFFE